MLKRLSWRVQPIEQIRKRKQRRRDMWERHEKFAKYVERVRKKRLLQSNCENNECNFMEVDCPFQTKSIYGFWTCSIEGRPSCWGLTEVQKNEHGQKY